MSKYPRHHGKRLFRNYKKLDYEMNEHFLRKSHPAWFE